MLSKHFIPILLISGFFMCKNPETESATLPAKQTNITCTNQTCSGTYKGPEFIKGSDLAHQFSNKMSEEVGHQLKILYKAGNYSKVDFTTIEMSTQGMGSGTVVYKLTVPFKQVKEACDAYTSFDHVGGWNHAPALSARKAQLSKVLLKGESLYISDLKTTPKGFKNIGSNGKTARHRQNAGSKFIFKTELYNITY